MTIHAHPSSRRPSTSPDDPRPLAGYGALMAAYGAGAALLALGLRRRKHRVQPLSAMDLLLLALATEHLSRLVTKDAITSPLRSPFTAFDAPAGEGEVNEEVVGSGLRQAVGELLTCPFCVSQWIATGLVAGGVAVPELTTAAVSVCAAARMSDFLQLAYGILRERQ